MKNILFALITIFSFQFVSAQEATNVYDNTLYSFAGIELKPEFPGGMDQFHKFVAANYNLPEAAPKLNGKVFVTFVVEKDGSLTFMKVLRDLGYGTGNEALRVLALSPKWMPGEQNGKKVRCTFSVPLSIKSK
jgi:periplasmic protein TonB